MNSKPNIEILFYGERGENPLTSTKKPRKCIVKTGFGALKRRCWLELFNEDLDVPAQVGYIMEVHINKTCCFRGRIQQRRIDSVDDQLSFYAEFDPLSEYNQLIYGNFEGQTPTGILNGILEESNLSRGDDCTSEISFDRIIFSGETLFAAIDLLAKLAGNWIWDVRDDGKLLFRPSLGLANRTIALRRDADAVNLWQTTTDRYGKIELDGSEGNNYSWIVETLGQYDIPNNACVRVFMNSIAASDAAEAVRQAVVGQMSAPHYERYVDLIGRGEDVYPGESVNFRIDNLPAFPQDQQFRVKKREITYAHESLSTRLYLTTGFESAESYFHFFRVEHPIPRVGTFQMDVSALDSIAYLDAGEI